MKRVRFDHWQAMSDEIDAIIDAWPEDKLELAIHRAQSLLHFEEDPVFGRKKGSKSSNPRNDAILEAAHNIRRRKVENPEEAAKSGWIAKAIRAEIEASPVDEITAVPLLRSGEGFERAIRRAITTGVIKRIRTNKLPT